MDDDLLDQGIQQFGSQFRGIYVLLDQVHPFFGIHGALLFCGKVSVQSFNLFRVALQYILDSEEKKDET